MVSRIGLVALFGSMLALGQSGPAGSEPGEAQGKVKSRKLDASLKFTHSPVEACGVWVTSNDLLGPRETLLKTFDRLKAANFNIVLIDGLHLDRIRFPEADFCFCDYCKEHFKADTGIDLRPFEKGSDDETKWTQWKLQQTLAAVKYFEKVVHAARPGLPITAYVIPPDEMDARGQSWDLWARQGVLDAVAVSMYGADIRPAARQALARLGDAGRSRLICAISADQIPPPVYTAHVQAARGI